MTPREMTPQDRRYVVPTWARNGCAGKPRSGRMAHVDEMLDGGVRVVVLATGPTVHAFAAARGDEVLFVYVPHELRGRHIARDVVVALIGHYPADVAEQIRKVAERLARKKAA